MTIHNKGTYQDKLMLYVRPDKKELVKKAKKILKRENSSLSQFVIEKLEALVKLHDPGNPQQTLPEISARGGPYVAPKRCHFCAREPVDFVVYIPNRKKYPVCSPHKEELKAHPKWGVEK